MPLMSCAKKILKFSVLGKPKGQGRPRFSARGHYVHVYDPKDSADEKAVIRLAAQEAVKQQNWEMPSPEMPVAIKIDLFCPIPVGRSQWFKEAAVQDIIVPLAKPDADNVAKMYMDAMSKSVYCDDKQVFRLAIERHYSDTPRVEVQVVGYFLNLGEIKLTALASLKAKKKTRKEGK